MSAGQPRFSLPESGSVLVRRTTIGTGVAVAAVLVVQALIEGLAVGVGGSGPMSPFAAGPLVGTTVVAGAVAAVVYAALVRFTDRPIRNFFIVAGAAFTLQLVPVFVLAPSLGVTTVGQAVLVLYHVLVAVPIVAFLVGTVSR